jgi:hypothetical protein
MTGKKRYKIKDTAMLAAFASFQPAWLFYSSIKSAVGVGNEKAESIARNLAVQFKRLGPKNAEQARKNQNKPNHKKRKRPGQFNNNLCPQGVDFSLEPGGTLKFIRHPFPIKGHPINLKAHPIPIKGCPIKFLGYPIPIIGHPIKFIAHPIPIRGSPIKFLRRPIPIKGHPINLAAPGVINKNGLLPGG